LNSTYVHISKAGWSSAGAPELINSHQAGASAFLNLRLMSAV
jgi:hypothetical protein